MLKEERLSFILAEVRKQKKVLTSELSQSLTVSEDTIRRDLKELADLGQLRKVHGGAIANSLNPSSYQEREIYALENKIAIVEKAITLIKDHQVVIMDGGTTNLELARRLPQELRITIFTNSLPIAALLSEHPHIQIVFAGGKLLKSAKVTVGLEVLSAFRHLRADIGILGTRSIHHEHGITELDWEEVKVKRAIVEASQHLVSMAISEKLETLNPYKAAEIHQLHTLITDLNPQDDILTPYREAGIKIY